MTNRLGYVVAHCDLCSAIITINPKTLRILGGKPATPQQIGVETRCANSACSAILAMQTASETWFGGTVQAIRGQVLVITCRLCERVHEFDLATFQQSTDPSHR